MLFVFHKSIGLLVLGLVIVRLLWKFFDHRRPMVFGVSKKSERLAHIGHGLLYMVMVVLPISGWLLNAAAGFPLRWMNLWLIPDVFTIANQWESLASFIHHGLFYLFLVLLSGHILMGLVHYYLHDGYIFKRMTFGVTSPYKILFFFAVFFVGSFLLIVKSANSDRPVTTKTQQDTYHQALSFDNAKAHTTMQWSVISESSQLGFVGDYSGSPFSGEFTDFNAQIFFNPVNPKTAYFSVAIDLTSVSTGNSLWDSVVLGEDWFFTERYPQTYFQASEFYRRGEGFIANGVLTLKGVSKPLELNFSWESQENGGVYFSATASINRHDFAFGEGDWAEGSAIGMMVEVMVSFELAPINRQGGY